jgi:hypothetical protein
VHVAPVALDATPAGDVTMARRSSFPFLGAIVALLYLAAGAAVLAGGALGVRLVEPEAVGLLAGSAAGFVVAVPLAAVAELLRLGLAIERNTRR